METPFLPNPCHDQARRHGFCDSLFALEIRTVICSTNSIESHYARYRRAVRARGHFPTEQATLKCLYLVARSLDPTGRGRTRWTMRWKPALNPLPSPSKTAGRPRKPTNQRAPETPLMTEIVPSENGAPVASSFSAIEVLVAASAGIV